MSDSRDDTSAVNAALIDGLVEARRRGLRGMTARNGHYTKVRFRFSDADTAALKLLRHALSLACGRPVAQALTLRWALTCAGAREATKAINDPAIAAKLRADVIALRDNTNAPKGH
jgi:hypothetical protein